MEVNQQKHAMVRKTVDRQYVEKNSNRRKRVKLATLVKWTIQNRNKQYRQKQYLAKEINTKKAIYLTKSSPGFLTPDVEGLSSQETKRVAQLCDCNIERVGRKCHTWNPETKRMMKENYHIRRKVEGNQQKQTRESKKNTRHFLINKN